MTTEMTIEARGTTPQRQLLNLKSKYNAFVGGYGSGKSFVGSMALCRHAWEFPRVKTGYFAPTYTQIRDIFFPTIEEVAYNMGLRVDIKTSNKEVHYFRGKRYKATTLCRSMDKPGSIVGFKIGYANVDEMDIMATDKAEEAWRKIVARLRHNGDGVKNGADVTTTPEGFKFTYQRFVLNRTESYGLIQASTYSNQRNLPADYIPSLLETYPAEVVAAYLNGEFVNMVSGPVYPNYDRKKHYLPRDVLLGTKDKPGESLYIGQDFNVGKMTSAICVRDDDRFTVAAQLVGIYDTPALIKTLQEKYQYNTIYIYPDASGASRKTVNASTSDIALLKQAGFTVRVNRANPAVKDRILSVNKAFQEGKLYINHIKAKNIAEAVEKQAYDENGEPDKKTGYDHACDALGYIICYEMPIKKPVIIPGVRMIH